jgi:hypothetical protein
VGLLPAHLRLDKSSIGSRIRHRLPARTPWCGLIAPTPSRIRPDYPSVTFEPGDNVTIRAGGCVQSGGWGDTWTWHRYVNPSGPDTPRLYHGLITIPYATGTLDHIQTHWNQTVHVADAVPQGARIHLQLGFDDGNYGDNSYDDHDDGPDGQCKGPDGGPAWVELHIKHHAAGPTNSLASWDLELTQFDDNGIPLDPDWHSNVAKAGFPDPGACRWPWQSGSAKNCTSQITNTDYDVNAGYSFWNPIKVEECASCSLCQSFSTNEGFGGHANWTAATYTGTVLWEEKSDPGADDGYSVNLATPHAAGATAGRTDGLHVEFDSDETIDPLTDDFQLPFFLQFRSAVDSGDSQAHDFLDGKDMIVTGLVGVDFAHTPSGESHPAWSVAIHANTDPADDTWAFFVRNWGDEGYCSESQHYIYYLDNIYMLRIPWPAGATSGIVNGNTISKTDSSITMDDPVFDAATRTVVITFRNLPDPTVHGLIGGELHFTWQGATPMKRATRFSRRLPLSPPGKAETIVHGLPLTSPDKAETIVRDLVARMTPEQRQVYQANLPSRPRAHREVRKVTMHTGPSLGMRRLLAGRHPRVTAIRDIALVQRRNAGIEAIRKAYGGKIPVEQ